MQYSNNSLYAFTTFILLFQCGCCSYFIETHVLRSHDNTFDINWRSFEPVDKDFGY